MALGVDYIAHVFCFFNLVNFSIFQLNLHTKNLHDLLIPSHNNFKKIEHLSKFKSESMPESIDQARNS